MLLPVNDFKTASSAFPERVPRSPSGRPRGDPATGPPGTAMILLVAVAVTAVGWLSYRNLEQALLPRVLDHIEAHSRLVASDLQAYVAGARADVATFSSRAEVQGMVAAHLDGGIDPVDRLSENAWRERLTNQLVMELGAKPAYSKFRFIGVADGGRELVRVDRSGPNGSIRVVPDAELQQKGERPYFQETVKLAEKEIYVSPINLNQEHGRIETPHVPTLRVAAPVFAPNGKVFGIFVINVDMRPALDGIRLSQRQGEQIYLVDAKGDYLVHPDRTREFASDLGGQGKWKDDLPHFASLVGTRESAARVVPDETGWPGGAALVPAVLVGQQWVGVVETEPNALF